MRGSLSVEGVPREQLPLLPAEWVEVVAHLRRREGSLDEDIHLLQWALYCSMHAVDLKAALRLNHFGEREEYWAERRLLVLAAALRNVAGGDMLRRRLEQNASSAALTAGGGAHRQGMPWVSAGAPLSPSFSQWACEVFGMSRKSRSCPLPST